MPELCKKISIIDIKPTLLELRKTLRVIMNVGGEYESSRCFAKKQLASHICHLSFLVERKGHFYILKVRQAARESVSSFYGLPAWAPMYQDVGDLIEEVMRWGYTDYQRVEYLKFILSRLPDFLAEYREATGNKVEQKDMEKAWDLSRELISCGPDIFISNVEDLFSRGV